MFVWCFVGVSFSIFLSPRFKNFIGLKDQYRIDQTDLLFLLVMGVLFGFMNLVIWLIWIALEKADPIIEKKILPFVNGILSKIYPDPPKNRE